jgi:hypothetical protein
VGYNASDLSPLYAYNVTPNGSQGGVWQSGGQPTFDQSGDIYVATGNGTFDVNTGGVDYGDSLLRLGIRNGVFGVIDYFTPFDQGTSQPRISILALAEWWSCRTMRQGRRGRPIS